MPNWKKVAVSGSSPFFNNITASGDISASGNISGETITSSGNIQNLDGYALFQRTSTGANSVLNVRQLSTGNIAEFGTGTNNELVVISSSGNVGIGTGTPLSHLHISTGSGDTTVIIEADPTNTVETDVPRLWFKADGGITEGAIQLNNNYLDIISNVSGVGGISFKTGTENNTGTTDPATKATESMRITSDGKVGIGNINPPKELTVSGSISASGHLFFSASENSSTSYKTLVVDPTTGKVFRTGSYASGGGGGTFPFTGDAVITGSLTVDASSSTSQSLSVIGSGSVVFDVIGSVGTLLEIDDDLSGTLFTANDQNGIPSFEVSASGEVYLGRAPQSLYTTVQKGPLSTLNETVVLTLNSSSYNAVFIEYFASDNAENIQQGTFMGSWMQNIPNPNNNGSTFSMVANIVHPDRSGLKCKLRMEITNDQVEIIVGVGVSDLTLKSIVKAI